MKYLKKRKNKNEKLFVAMQYYVHSRVQRHMNKQIGKLLYDPLYEQISHELFVGLLEQIQWNLEDELEIRICDIII